MLVLRKIIGRFGVMCEIRLRRIVVFVLKEEISVIWLENFWLIIILRNFFVGSFL